MAVQIPDPGTGNNKSGDNEYVFRKKVKDNFSDQTNAASRLVGTAAGNVMQVGAFGLGIRLIQSGLSAADVGHIPSGYNNSGLTSAVYYRDSIGDPAYTQGISSVINLFHQTTTSNYESSGRILLAKGELYVQSVVDANNWGVVKKIYNTGNTTIVNGNLKPSSPVVKIHTDSLELNADAEKMGVTLNKHGVGDYLIQNTSGLRKDDGWYIELPQDVNGNPYFAVTYNQLENNDIEVKTYKRIFDMTTFMFVPDLENPVDIKEGRSIAIRLNDLPQDDIQTEV